MTTTLSLADIARLAHVERPVVTMWRKRAAGTPFPTPFENGRYEATDVVDWLEATGRGNNPDARADLAVRATVNANTDPGHLGHLLTLLAARALLDEPLSTFDHDDLLDAVDELDPDDEFLFGEIEALEYAAYDSLAVEADALAEAAWHTRAAYEQLGDALARATTPHDERMRPDLVTLLASLTRSLLGGEGTLVDLAGTATDVAIVLSTDDDAPAPRVTLPGAAGSSRSALQRYRVHRVVPKLSALEESWPLTDRSVTLLRVPAAPDDAFALLDELEVQLPPDGCALVIGPAAVLTDPLPRDLVARRDGLLRADLVRAAVRLPAGMTRGGSREHLALWLLARPSARSSLWVADLAGQSFDRVTSQMLLDDLLATRSDPRGRAFTLLHRADRTQVLTQHGSLVALTGERAVAYAPSAADDAARMEQLAATLAAPLPEAFPYAPTAIRSASPHRISLDAAAREHLVRILPGVRLSPLPEGSTRLWTSDAVAARRPSTVDLIRLTEAHPNVGLTKPGDVVFTTSGQPAAVVDREGGSAVAYPARILRITTSSLAPSAVADAINRVAAGNGKWRTWQVPVLRIERAYADDVLAQLDTWDARIRERQTQLAELRRLVTRSVLSGAVTLTKLDDDDPHHHSHRKSYDQRPDRHQP